MAVKAKVSKTKRNNQTKTKLIKRGVIKKTKKPKQIVKHEEIKSQQNINEIVEEESDHEDMLEDGDEYEMEFLRNFVRGVNNKKMKNLLPIKTKRGVIPQQVVVPHADKPDPDEEETRTEETSSQDVQPELETEVDIDMTKPISATQLMVARNEVLRNKKIVVGSLCAGLLENPEEKVTNFRTLLALMDDETNIVYWTIRKLLVVSLTEVFKDILPSYEIKNVNPDGVKLKKDTLRLQKYEDNLLVYYKNFLKKLEKYMFVLVKKVGDSRKRSGDEVKLATLAVQAMCDLLVAHPYFNFSGNIVQAIVPFLNNRNKEVRDIVKTSVKTIFKEDKKEETTLKLLRNINSYLKNHSHNVHEDMLEVLLVLNLQNVNLDQEKEHDMKQKKLMAHKSRVLQMSKKERKRKKRLIELEKELLETKAEESKQTKEKTVTEITKILFNIYFRILKTSSNNKVLAVCLQGLAKYAHCINLEYYVDVVNVLDKLLQEDWLTYIEKLHCVQTVFAILSGQGEVLNIDPTRFYNNLYKDLLKVTAASKKVDYVKFLMVSLVDALIKRRKKITNKRTLGFVKRLATLSLQLNHDGSLACLGLIRNIMQLNRSVDILLDFDSSVGEGQFQPEIDDPEYSNAASTALYELNFLKRHYHPVVQSFTKHIALGVPASGEGSLSGEYAKVSPEQLAVDFDMSEMAFNPPVPVPKATKPKLRAKRHCYADSSLEEECRRILRDTKDAKMFWITDL